MIIDDFDMQRSGTYTLECVRPRLQHYWILLLLLYEESLNHPKA